MGAAKKGNQRVAPTYTHIFSRRYLFVTLLLGFSSGLPLALTAGTLQAWFTVSNIDILTIGFLTLVGQPYVYKFFWAPLMDRYHLPFLGRRRGWMLVTQILLIISISGMAILQPSQSPGTLACIALVVSFLSASQDIVVDAWRTEIFPAEERGIGAAIFVSGYRLSMLVSGALALVLADHIGFQQTYLYMAAFMLTGLIATYLAPEPAWIASSSDGKSPFHTFFAAMQELWIREGIILLLIFLVLYKLGDAFAAALLTTFLIKGLGFSLTTLGTVYKTVGLTATILGAFAGGLLLVKLKLYRSLMLFGILQAVAILAYMALAMVGQNYAVMIIAIFVENFFAGMATDGFVAMLMGLCNQQFTATQYALLAALTAIGRVFVGPLAAVIVQQAGWVNFFFFSFLVCIPGLILLYYLKNQSIFKSA